MKKILIVDDSATCRAALRLALERDPDLLVVGEAENQASALRIIARTEPDLVTMDVFLEHENGLEVAAEIMARCPLPIVVVSSADCSDPELVFRTLRVGALDVMPKPPAPNAPDYDFRCRTLQRRLRTLSSVPVLHARSDGARKGLREPNAPSPTGERDKLERSASPPTRLAGSSSPARVVVIGASTGGPSLIADMLLALPRPFPLPIVIAQHISSGFGTGLARWLTDTTSHDVRAVLAPCSAEPGVVYVPPDDSDIFFVDSRRLSTQSAAPTATVAPGIDVLFESTARFFEGEALGVLLTGMGRDGAQGLLTLRNLGARTIVQEPSTCVVDGMPQAAISRGAATAVLPPREIVRALTAAVSHESRGVRS